MQKHAVAVFAASLIALAPLVALLASDGAEAKCTTGHVGEAGYDPNRKSCHGARSSPNPPPTTNGTRIEGTLFDGYAVVEEYKEWYNPGNLMQEGKITFPTENERELITNLHMIIGNVTYGSSVEDKTNASAKFQQALREGRNASLIQYDGPKTYSLHVTLPAKESRTAYVTWEMLLRRVGGYYEYTYHLDMDTTGGAKYLNLDLTVKATTRLKEVLLPNHPNLPIQRVDERTARISMSSLAEAGGKSLVVLFATESSSTGLSVNRTGGERYFKYTLDAANLPPEIKHVGREIVFAVDSSGTMGKGGRRGMERDALVEALGALEPQDRFNLVSFTGVTKSFTGGLVGATVENKEKALSFLDSVKPGGSSNIRRAVQTAYSELLAGTVNPSASRYIVLISDGNDTSGSGGSKALIETARTEDAKGGLGAKLFALGIDSGNSSGLLEALAVGRGGAGYYAERAQGVAGKGVALVNNLTAAMEVRNLTITVSGPNVTEVVPEGKLFMNKGGEASVFGKFNGEGNFTVKVSGDTPTGPFTIEKTYEQEGAPDNPFIQKMWVMEQVVGLLNQITMKGENPDLVAKLKSIGYKYGIVTPYTSRLIDLPKDNLRSPSAGAASTRGMAPGFGGGALLLGGIAAAGLMAATRGKRANRNATRAGRRRGVRRVKR